MLTSSLLSSNDSSTIYEFITFAQNNNNSSSGSHGHMASDITGGGIQVSLDESSTCPSSSVSNNQSLISNTNSQNTAGMPSGSDMNTSNQTFSINTDMQRPVVYLINPVTDNITTVNLCQNSQYPSGSMPLHTLITPNGDMAFVSTMSSPTAPATILVLKIGNIDWETGKANVSISNVIKIRDPNTIPTIIPKIGNHSTNHTQPVIEALWFPNNVQIHGPTLHPSEKFAYFTEWTNNTIRILNVNNGTLASKDPVQFDDETRWLHGVFFNPSGNKALSPHYFFEGNHVHLFDVNSTTGELTNPVGIRLGNSTHYAAFPHHVTWINNTHAITSTQQLGPTNATADNVKIIGPSVWLIDTRNVKAGEEGNDTSSNAEAATMIIPFTNSTQNEGIYKPASDTAIIGTKLYVAEEDSMDTQIDKEGQVSIWNISNILDPQLIKRMSPGSGLPENFELGHTIYSTPDGKTVYVEDWHSGQLVKINTTNDTVLKVFDKNSNGFKMPHGGFITGKYR